MNCLESDVMWYKHVYTTLHHFLIGQLTEYKGSYTPFMFVIYSFYVRLHHYMTVSLEAVAVLAACSNRGGIQGELRP